MGGENLVAISARATLDMSASRQRLARRSYVLALALHTFAYIAKPSYLGDFEATAKVLSSTLLLVEVLVPTLLAACAVLDGAGRRGARGRMVLIVLGFVLQGAVTLGPASTLGPILWFLAAYPSSLSLEDALKAMLVAGAVTSAVIIALGVSGSITDNIRYEHGRLRHGLGFQLGIFLSYDLSALLLCWVYVRLRRWRFVDYAVSFSVALVVYGVGNGRASFYMVMGVLLGIAAWQISSRLQPLNAVLTRATKALAILCYPLLTVLSLFAGSVLGDPDVYKSNEAVARAFGWLVGSRANYWHVNMEEIGLSLRGSSASLNYALDNLFLWLSLVGGILVLLAMCVLHVVWALRADARRDYYQLLFVVVLAAFSFTCMFTNSIVVDPTLLFIAQWLSGGVGADSRYDWGDAACFHARFDPDCAC